MKKDPELLAYPERLVEEAKNWCSYKYNLTRMDAAFDFRVQIVQRQEKGGNWIPVGNSFRPLTIEDQSECVDYTVCEDGNKGQENQVVVSNSEKKNVTIEGAVLELNLDHMGLITNSLRREGKSIDQSLKSGRSSAFYYYLRIILAVLFFGGLLVKSFVEDTVAKRDVERILKFYKHVLPGSFSDGDTHNARYLVWKYRGKMESLWKKLETKYGVPVLHPNEWDEYVINTKEKTSRMGEKSNENDDDNEEDSVKIMTDTDL